MIVAYCCEEYTFPRPAKMRVIVKSRILSFTSHSA